TARSFFCSSRRRHTRSKRDWSSDVCSSDLQRTALETAAARIRAYHEHQLQEDWSYTEANGTRLGQRITPLDRVGLYVPGGKAAFPSSVLLYALPSKVLGVLELIMVLITQGGERNDLLFAA